MEGQGKDCGLDGAPIPLHPGGEMSEKELTGYMESEDE